MWLRWNSMILSSSASCWGIYLFFAKCSRSMFSSKSPISAMENFKKSLLKHSIKCQLFRQSKKVQIAGKRAEKQSQVAVSRAMVSWLRLPLFYLPGIPPFSSMCVYLRCEKQPKDSSDPPQAGKQMLYVKWSHHSVALTCVQDKVEWQGEQH